MCSLPFLPPGAIPIFAEVRKQMFPGTVFRSPFFFFMRTRKRKEMASLVPQMVKNLPALQESWVHSLGQEDPSEKGMNGKYTPVFLPEESHGSRSLAGYSLWGRKELDTTEWLTISRERKKEILISDTLKPNGCSAPDLSFLLGHLSSFVQTPLDSIWNTFYDFGM